MTDMLLENPVHEHAAFSPPDSPAAQGSVLMFAYYFPPVASAGIFRTVRFVKYLPECGWTPIVITVDPDCMNERRDPALLDQIPGGTTIVKTPVFFPERWLSRTIAAGKTPAGSSRSQTVDSARPIEADAGPANSRPGASGIGIREYLRRLRDLVFFTPDQRVWWLPTAVSAGLRAIRKYDPKVIYTTGPPHSTHLIGLVLRRLTGLPWVADFRDPWSRQPWGAKVLNPWGSRLLPLFESQVIRYASTVILNTPRMADEFRSFHVQERPSKFVAIPNGFDPDFRGLVRGLVDSAGVERASGRLRLCHAGSLYHRRNADYLLLALRRLVDCGIDVCFEQIGTCDNNAALTRRIEELGLGDHVSIEPPIPHHDALQRMARADILVLIQPDNKLQVPGKLYEMMLFEKPILSLVDDGAVADIVIENRLGEVAASADVEQIVAAIGRLALQLRERSPEDRLREASISSFDGQALSRRFADTLTATVRRFGKDDAADHHGGEDFAGGTH